MTIESCLTTSGLNVLAQAQTGSTITFTKLAIGDGEITNIQAADLTELINTVQDVTITSKSLDGSTTVSFTGTIEQGESGFYYREIGLYALDPDTGDEVLYAYGNKGDEATYIPAVSSSIVVSQKVTMAVTVANSDNITVNIGAVEATRDNDYNIFCVNTGVIDSSGEPDFMNITQQLVIESTYSSDGISNFNVNTETYFDTATTYGDYVFTYSSGEWLLNDDAVTLSDYGITFTELFTASASYDSSGITGVELDEEQTLSAVNKTAGTYNFVANIIEGNADERITYEYSSDTLTDVTVDTSVYFDNADTGSYSFKFKWDSITYEDSDGNLAENDITYSDDDENTSTGSMYYVDSDGNAVVGLISYEDSDGNISGQWYTTDDENDYTVEVDLTEYGITVEGTPDNGDLIEVTVDELVDNSFYWTLSGSTVDLDDYGISYTGTPADNDIITVVVTSLLADGDTITVTVEDPEDEEVSQVYMLQTQGVFTVTIANGSSYTVSDQLTCSISGLSEGVYNVYVDPVNSEITVIDNNITAGIIMPSSAASSDYLLNISQIPYDLQSKSESGLTAVRAGILTISDLGKFLTLFRYNTNNLHGITNTVNQIGEPIVSLNSVLADNEIWLEGAEISCTSYPALYEVYGDTYGTASTDGYFVLPDFRERAIWGSDSFGYIDAGLPDLYGYIGVPSNTSDGSLFYGTRSGNYYDHDSSGGKCQYGKMYFKASNYDSIYGNSDTVQPPAIRVRVKTRFI